MANITANSDDWISTTNRFVGFIDIMGFKDLVARTPHQDIYQMMQKLTKSLKFNESIEWAKVKTKLVRSTTYSDSIIIYSKDNSYESLYSLICSISSLTYDMFIEGIPHKGAIAFGEMTLDNSNSIYFGQPLIDAYLLQEELNFYGFVVHSTAQIHIDKFMGEKGIPFTHTYLCPFKSGASKHLTIYPIYAGEVKDDEEEDQNKLINAIANLRYKTSGHLRKYIDSTEAYITYINENS